MLTDRHFPYSSMQEINLDWILTKVKNILRFVPDDGAVGQILRRTAHGAEWSNEQGGGGAVTSVNGQTGDVILSIPTDTSDLNNDSGFVDAAGAAAAAPVQSVNGQTGAVTLSIPTDTSDLNNDSGFVDAAGAAAAAPVQSVNGQTGAVTLSIPTDTSDLNNDSGFVDAAGAAAAAPVQSVNGQTGAVVLNDYETGTITYARTLGSGVLDQRNCFRVGNAVNIGVRVYNITEPAAGSWFAVPSAFIPSHDCCISGTMEVGGVWYPLFALVHSGNGLIDVNWSSGSTATQVQVYGTYILD